MTCVFCGQPVIVDKVGRGICAHRASKRKAKQMTAADWERFGELLGLPKKGR